MATALRTANPALSSDAFTSNANALADRFSNRYGVSGANNTMTLNGAIGKTAILLALLVGAGAMTWNMVITGTAAATLIMMGGFIGGFILALITIFKKEASPITAPLYAIAEGCALGGVSAIYNVQYHGIVFQAVGLTVAILAAMLIIYATRLIQPTAKFTLGVAAATGGIAIFYLVAMVLGFFNIHVPLVFGSGPVGIGFSVVVVVLAALNLVIDFGVIESGVQARAPKYMEWYGGFGLMVTLVWLYLEALRLLAKLRGRD